MNYTSKSLFRLIEDINTSLFLPHIQRPFVWDEEQIVRLFDSLMRDYPIQTLLFWRTTDEIKARRFMDSVEWDADLHHYYDSQKSREGIEKVFVLDGQQRLQSLLSIFSGSLKSADGKTDLDAHLNITSGSEPIADDLLYKLEFREGEQSLPLYRIRNLLGRDSDRNAFDLANVLNVDLDKLLTEDENERTCRQRRVHWNLGQMIKILREDGHFWLQELDGVANRFAYKKVVDIFVRVNSGGTKLDASDLMFAAMKEGWADVEQNVEGIAEMLNTDGLKFDKSFPLKCLVVTHGRGSELSPEKFTSTAGDVLLARIRDDWPKAEETFKQLCDFVVHDLKLYSDKVVRSYGSFVPIFDYLYHNPRPDERSRILLRAYYYKSQLFNWYGAQTDSVINAMHSRVGKPTDSGFPIAEVKDYFSNSRGATVELQLDHLLDMRLRFIVLNLIYVERWGAGPFRVKSKGNAPHIDHIYPQSMLRNRLQLETADINHIGNYRFVGATDNIRKRAELPGPYFTRLKEAGVNIANHLLVPDFSTDPTRMEFDELTYRAFRDRRLQCVFDIASQVVNPETR